LGEFETKMRAKMDVNREKMKADQEMLAKMDATQAKTEANLREIIEDMNVRRKEMKANPDEMKSVMVHGEVPKEHVAVNPVGGLRKRHRAGIYPQSPAKSRRIGPGGNCGSRKKLAADRRRTARCAGVERRKGHGRNNVARAPKG
jgi:uncharacterized protein (DUF885 family)